MGQAVWLNQEEMEIERDYLSIEELARYAFSFLLAYLLVRLKVALLYLFVAIRSSSVSHLPVIG
jgi:hypothetical protein